MRKIFVALSGGVAALTSGAAEAHVVNGAFAGPHHGYEHTHLGPELVLALVVVGLVIAGVVWLKR